MSRIPNFSVLQNSGATFMARVIKHDGTPITQADVSAITFNVFDLQAINPEAAIATGSVDVSDSVSDTLQLTAQWTKDATGYNFLYDMPATTFAAAQRRYRVEYVVVPVVGTQFILPFGVFSERTYS